MANNMLLGAILMWKQLFVKSRFIVWWESSKDYEIFKWQNALMFLKIIIEFLASQCQFCVWGIGRLFLRYCLLLRWASSVTTLINILLTWGARGWVTRGGEKATWGALQSLEHLLSTDFKALDSVWWSCELRSTLLLGCVLVIGLQYIIEKYSPELFSWLLGQCSGQEMTLEHWLTGNWGTNG